MAATLTTSTWNLAYDYSDYYERIASALENIAANTSATLATLNSLSTITNIASALQVMADNSTTMTSYLSTLAASSTATLVEISTIASTATLINKSLETITLASIVSAISSSPYGVVDMDGESRYLRGDATYPDQAFGKLPTFNYMSTASTAISAEFSATVGGNTGTWLFVNDVVTGTIVANMELSVPDPNTTASTRLNLIMRQLDGAVGGIGTYELRDDTGFKIHLNKGDSSVFTTTAVLHTGTDAVVSVTPFGDLTDGLFSTLINTLPKSI